MAYMRSSTNYVESSSYLRGRVYLPHPRTHTICYPSKATIVVYTPFHCLFVTSFGIRYNCIISYDKLLFLRKKDEILLSLFTIDTTLIMNTIKLKKNEAMAVYTLTEVDDKLWRKI